MGSLAAATAPLGLLLAAPVAEMVGVRAWYVTGGLVCLSMGVAGFFLPSLMRIEEAPEGMAKKPRTIDEYLAGLDAESRTALQKVRRAIHAAAPKAAEGISYGMPAFRLNGKLIAGFQAAANHCSFHPMSGATVATLHAELAKYDTSRGTIRFSPRAALPASLIRQLVKARIAEAEK